MNILKNKKVILIAVFILLAITILFISTSYALFRFDVTKNTDFKVVIGSLELIIKDNKDEDKIILNNVVPTKDDVALQQDGYSFTLTNTGTIDSFYSVYLDDILLDDAGERLDNKIIRFNLFNHTTNYNVTSDLNSYLGDNRLIASGILKKGESITYTLRLWVNYNADNTAQNKYFASQIRVVGTQANAVTYKEGILNGADPVLSGNLVPVVISDTGVVTKANTSSNWYSYADKKWANSVILKDKSINYKNDDIIPEDNIESYFVWIPKYRYEIFNEGNYTNVTAVDSKPSESAEQEINIVFESKNVTPSTGSTVGEYLTHPAFTTLGVDGIWVAKFETTGTTSEISALPNQASLRNINVSTMFNLAYNYDRTLDSHMMKNTEWGAVAYLSHSKYGINNEIRINNSQTFTTGCAATTPPLNYVGKSQIDHSEGYYNGCENEYNTDIGVLASTTGNITGVYDMSGGAWEYMASYRENTLGSSGFDTTSIATYDNKYFDIYSNVSELTTYNKRVLGDATGELGPFYSYKDSDNNNRYHSTWGNDMSNFVAASSPWFIRSSSYYEGVLAGSFAFHRGAGVANSSISFRLVLDK
mgnify:FL=1